MSRKVIQTDKAPLPVAPYSQAIVAQGQFIFVSGQIGTNPETKQLAEGVQAQTKQALDHIQAILTAAGASLSDVVKVTVLLHSIDDFKAMNEIYATYFPENPPARAAYGGLDLPLGALVEIECFAVIAE